MWRLLLAMLGVVVVVVAIIGGLLAGEVDKVLSDPELKKERERQQKERERQREWRRKIGKEEEEED